MLLWNYLVKGINVRDQGFKSIVGVLNFIQWYLKIDQHLPIGLGSAVSVIGWDVNAVHLFGRLANFCSITSDKRFYQLQNGKFSFSLLSLTWSGRQDSELAEKEHFSEGKYFLIQDGIFLFSQSDINKNQIVLLYKYSLCLLTIRFYWIFKMKALKWLASKAFFSKTFLESFIL